MIRILILGISFLFFSCNAFQNENNKVAFSWERDALVIENGSSVTIYYSVFEQDMSARINWSPASSEGNRILPNEVIAVQEEKIFGYESGDTIVLFYWTNDEPPFDNIETNVIETE